jgi:hypothetical protein
LSYIWPDELDRFERISAALELASRAPVQVAAQAAGEWLVSALAQRTRGELTVVWQSVFRQYVEPEEWQAIEAAVGDAMSAEPEAPVVWLTMEPGDDHLAHMKLSLLTHRNEPEQVLASCGDHGPPVEWLDRGDGPPGA